MKKKNNISASLGLKQEELAQLLQVSRSQLSLYELGKRSLPIHAVEKLAVLLSYTNKEKLKFSADSLLEKRSVLENLLLKNNHQLTIINCKIAALDRKIKATLLSKHIVASVQENSIFKQDLNVIKTIKLKKENQEIYKFQLELFQLQIKKEVLHYEEKILNKRLKT